MNIPDTVNLHSLLLRARRSAALASNSRCCKVNWSVLVKSVFAICSRKETTSLNRKPKPVNTLRLTTLLLEKFLDRVLPR